MCNKVKEFSTSHGWYSGFGCTWLPKSPLSCQWSPVLPFHDGEDLGWNASKVHGYASADVALVTLEYDPPVRSGRSVQVFVVFHGFQRKRK